ncbi:phage tail family protein [Clostridium sp. CCUG 7971]|uniref:phage tail family protein n=1 Tax=Clostridium sp. CCUG 7971 TaxID=2811414 RepID=UPI001ABA7BE7|nr:phage tail family protein [Clostridium sp. CCUG 7971]MBO3443416.1 phage tail family protein [Clostridium sp. CCUG 7971]
MRKLIYRNEKGQEVTFSSSRPFYLLSIENTSSSSISTTLSARDHGYDVDGKSFKERSIPITGAIDAFDADELDRKRNQLTRILNPLLDGELIYTNNNLTRKINVSIDSITFNKPMMYYQEFLIQFIAYIPFWEDINTYKADIALWEANFGFELEVDKFGVDLGSRVSNLICNINNPGDIECGIKVKFKALATVVNPKLININTREFIRINRTLERGDTLEVTTHYANKRIELLKSNGTKENVYHWLDLNSEFLKLDLGDNLFRYDADKGIDNLEVSIYYSPLYIGI